MTALLAIILILAIVLLVALVRLVALEFEREAINQRLEHLAEQLEQRHVHSSELDERVNLLERRTS